jgi:hypothetical protein
MAHGCVCFKACAAATADAVDVDIEGIARRDEAGADIRDIAPGC